MQWGILWRQVALIKPATTHTIKTEEQICEAPEINESIQILEAQTDRKNGKQMELKNEMKKKYLYSD